MNSIELGKLLKLTRQQKGLTQEQLAETLSVTTSAISKWENGKNLPDTDMLLKIALTLELSIEDLYYPEQTIARLTTISPQDSKTNVSCSLAETNNNTKNSKTSTKHRKLFIILSTIITICAIIGVLGYVYHRKHTLNITPIAFRTVEDVYFGTVYEVACIYTGDLDDTSQLNIFLDVMGIAWENDTFVPEEIIYKKISIYQTEEDAQAWGIPIQNFYLVR